MKRIFILIITLAFVASCNKNDEASIIGTASADGGNVTSGITVKLYNEGTDLVMDTTTDTEGNFSFTGLEAGNYFVGATITIDGTIWDTGNTPQQFYVSGEIVKEVSLTLTQK